MSGSGVCSVPAMRRVLPVVRIGEVFHVGGLDAAECDDGRWLAVSRCPKAWERVLGPSGGRFVSMKKLGAEGGGVFLDVQKAARSDMLRSEVEAWGRTKGYVSTQDAWKVATVDSRGRPRAVVVATEGEARVQARRCGVGDDAVSAVQVCAPTALLWSRVAVPNVDDRSGLGLEFLLVVWAEDQQRCLDGAWWHEAGGQAGRPASGGVVFSSRGAAWALAAVPVDAVRDDVNNAAVKTGFVRLE